MSAKKKAKKRLPKPALAWCALYDGKIKPGWCCAHRETTARWARNNPGGELVRVRITPVDPDDEPIRESDVARWTGEATSDAIAEAAGELLRAAKEAWPWVYGHPKQSDELWQAIAKAERAGIK